MSRRLEKLIEQKAWETLTDYGYNDAHLLEQLTESVLERLYEANETSIALILKLIHPVFFKKRIHASIIGYPVIPFFQALKSISE